MDVSGPVMPAWIALVREAATGHVIVESVHPHVHDVLRIPRNGEAPIEGRAADRQILQAGTDEADDLVAAGLRADEIRIRLVMFEQALLISGQAEEIALFLDPFHRRPGRGAPASVRLL